MSGPRRWRGFAALAVALAAGAALLFAGTRDDGPPAPPARTGVATAWPQAQRAQIPGNLPDGPVFQPGLFLDARTAIGTAPSPDGASLRLLLRAADGTLRELRRLALDTNPAFDTFTADGTTVVWTESTGDGLTVWAVDTASPAEPRRLTGDTGDAVFYGSQHDLVIAQGRVHWAAAAADATEIRSVPLTGGDVDVRVEPGEWAQTGWPWLTDGGANGIGTTTVRNPATSRDLRVATTGAELAACSPAWCRVVVMSGGDTVRIDVMRPDGTGRRRIAGGAATAAIVDVALLDRFEVLAETQPASDLTGTRGLVVYDIDTDRTVDLSPAVDGAFGRGGVLWWSTGGPDEMVWHTLDLRTV